MHSNHASAPPPELRIVPTESLYPHEEHDSQRALPLIERLRHEHHVINPPIVAPMGENSYVILDGANRCYAFGKLGFPHSLVQVVHYEQNVDLSTWQHVVSAWTEDKFIQHLLQMPALDLTEGVDTEAIAHVLFRSGRLIALRAPVATVAERNAALRQVVGIYQRNAVLHRTAIDDLAQIWELFPDPVALTTFPQYTPADIVEAARERAYLPPGVSRHIVHGRAIRVNYPLEALKNTSLTLEEKNEQLHVWLQNKVANRQMRYYAESTYQFDE